MSPQTSRIKIIEGESSLLNLPSQLFVQTLNYSDTRSFARFGMESLLRVNGSTHQNKYCYDQSSEYYLLPLVNGLFFFFAYRGISWNLGEMNLRCVNYKIRKLQNNLPETEAKVKLTFFYKDVMFYCKLLLRS